MISLKNYQGSIVVKLNDIQNVIVEHVVSYVHSENLSLLALCFLLTSDIQARGRWQYVKSITLWIETRILVLTCDEANHLTTLVSVC